MRKSTIALNVTIAAALGALVALSPSESAPAPASAPTASAAPAPPAPQYTPRTAYVPSPAEVTLSEMHAGTQFPKVVTDHSDNNVTALKPTLERFQGEQATIIAWVDGDTVDTTAGRVRLIGIDTPEMSQTCYGQKAKERAERLLPAGTAIKLGNPESVDDTDKYDRLLRYVMYSDYSGQLADAGYELIRTHDADARYDSQDGYQWHPYEAEYRAADTSANGSTTCYSGGDTYEMNDDGSVDWFSPDHVPGGDGDFNVPGWACPTRWC